MIFPDLQFWIKTPLDIFQLPIPPASFNVKSGTNGQEITLLKFGDINLPGTNKLKTFSIKSFFPSRNYSFCKCDPKDSPYEYVDILEDAKENQSVCRLVVTGTRLSFMCTVENFEWGEQDASRDVYFTLELKEYKILGDRQPWI